ncbi:MAG: SpoIIE family protein phosphatase [Calditrichaceae bacterium]
MNNKENKASEPKIGRTIIDDIRHSDFRRGLRRFMTAWWLLKGLFFHLTPVRRLLFVLAIILLFTSRQVIILGQGQTEVSTNLGAFGGLLLIFIIMLELKDKLLAKTELREGRAIQTALMPDKNPTIAGWDVWMYSRPANDVGGDLVDYLPLDTNRFGISLADVSGKGLGAALFMAKLQATIRAIAPDYQSLSDLTGKLNNIFYRDSVANRFASLIYLQIGAKENKIRYVNAGHFPPFIVRDNEIKELPKGDPALGLSTKSLYKEKNLQLNENDIFFIYSDGLTEAMNENSEFFGEERLSSLLDQLKGYPANYIGENIIQKVDYFIGEAMPADDLSMVILKKK